MKNKFSIIIPFGKRAELLPRAVNSILSQTYPEWELIIVDDGTEMDVEGLLPKDNRIKVLHQAHLNRIYAQNMGMEAAVGDWLCLLDSDDAYMPHYLEACNQFIEEFPEYKLFNFGSIVFSAKGTRGSELFNESHLREVFEHEDFAEFRGGVIAQGNFIFHRLAFQDVGPMPPSTSPYGFADEMKKRFPDLLKSYGPLYREGGKELGNPWGNDFALYFMLTRKYKHKTIPLHLYIQYAHL